MKYINKLNINFDQWEELNKLNNGCIYLVFRNTTENYLGYIKNNKLYLLNKPQQPNSLKAISNVYYTYENSLIFYKYRILYKDLIRTDFYKNNKILIVGVDVDKKDILKNPKLYEIDCKIKNINLK
jgi:hypothetical protein